MRPNEGVWEDITPNEGVWEDITPDEGVWEDITPNEGVREDITPNEGVWEDITPNEGVRESVRPDDWEKGVRVGIFDEPAKGAPAKLVVTNGDNVGRRLELVVVLVDLLEGVSLVDC